ncbi:hypothetical protein [Streptomyces bungoensis]|uniref:hypothetical protein n=1 Tax=Streptomyces bungoensis TaxID=285568 RepID=UPI0034273D6D
MTGRSRTRLDRVRASLGIAQLVVLTGACECCAALRRQGSAAFGSTSSKRAAGGCYTSMNATRPRLKGNGVHQAMLGIARLHNLALSG